MELTNPLASIAITKLALRSSIYNKEENIQIILNNIFPEYETVSKIYDKEECKIVVKFKKSDFKNLGFCLGKDEILAYNNLLVLLNKYLSNIFNDEEITSQLSNELRELLFLYSNNNYTALVNPIPVTVSNSIYIYL